MTMPQVTFENLRYLKPANQTHVEVVEKFLGRHEGKTGPLLQIDLDEILADFATKGFYPLERDFFDPGMNPFPRFCIPRLKPPEDSGS